MNTYSALHKIQIIELANLSGRKIETQRAREREKWIIGEYARLDLIRM